MEPLSHAFLRVKTEYRPLWEHLSYWYKKKKKRGKVCHFGLPQKVPCLGMRIEATNTSGWAFYYFLPSNRHKKREHHHRHPHHHVRAQSQSDIKQACTIHMCA